MNEECEKTSDDNLSVYKRERGGGRESTLRRVDFPHPLGPRSIQSSPSGMLIQQSRRIGMALESLLKLRCKCFTSMATPFLPSRYVKQRERTTISLFSHSRIQSINHASIHPSIHSSIHPFIHSSIHPSIHSFIHSCAQSILTHSYHVQEQSLGRWRQQCIHSSSVLVQQSISLCPSCLLLFITKCSFHNSSPLFLFCIPKDYFLYISSP